MTGSEEQAKTYQSKNEPLREFVGCIEKIRGSQLSLWSSLTRDEAGLYTQWRRLYLLIMKFTLKV